MRDSIEKFFDDASSYFGELDPVSTALMRSVFLKVSKDFNISANDRKLRRTLALIIFCAIEDEANDEDEVFENAHRWMSYISTSNKAIAADATIS